MEDSFFKHLPYYFGVSIIYCCNYLAHIWNINMHVPCRSAVKDEEEWPSKYSKFFIEVGDNSID